MTRLLVIAGTADAVQFVAGQPAEVEILATTFSQLGADCLAPRPGLRLHSGALDLAGFAALLAAEQPDFVVDLSHHAKAAAARQGVEYLRFERQASEAEGCLHFADFAAAAAACQQIEGNILLTIGSKNLAPFSCLPDFQQRFYLRVLAESRILQELEAMHIDPGHIFAMKGVASVELNVALARQCQAAAIVSKDSGRTGGVPQKLAAAQQLGIPLLLIDRPPAEDNACHSLAELEKIIYGNV